MPQQHILALPGDGQGLDDADGAVDDLLLRASAHRPPGGLLRQAHHQAGTGDTGVINQDINATKFLHSSVHHSGSSFVGGNISLQHQSLAAHSFNFSSNCFSSSFAASIVNYYVSALSSQCQSNSAADAARSTSY